MKIVKFENLVDDSMFVFDNKGFKRVPTQVAVENNESYNAIELKNKDYWFFAGDEEVAVLEKV